MLHLRQSRDARQWVTRQSRKCVLARHTVARLFFGIERCSIFYATLTRVKDARQNRRCDIGLRWGLVRGIYPRPLDAPSFVTYLSAILCFTLRLFDIVKQSRRLLFHTPILSDFTDDDVSAKDFWVHVRYTMIG